MQMKDGSLSGYPKRSQEFHSIFMTSFFLFTAIAWLPTSSPGCGVPGCRARGLQDGCIIETPS